MFKGKSNLSPALSALTSLITTLNGGDLISVWSLNCICCWYIFSFHFFKS